MRTNKNGKELIELYKNKITPCNKTLDELLEYLDNKFEFSILKKYNDRILRDINIFKSNVFFAAKSVGIILNTNNQNVIVIKIFRNKNSEKYISELDTRRIIDNSLLIFIEPTIIYTDCESNSLNIELIIFRGVTKFDIENKTARYITYLRLLYENSS